MQLVEGNIYEKALVVLDAFINICCLKLHIISVSLINTTQM